MKLDVPALIEPLIAQGEAVLKTSQQTIGGYGVVNVSAMAEWSMNAVTLVRSMFGTGSEHYTRMHAAASDTPRTEVAARVVLAGLKAAKSAWAQGYVFDLQGLIRAEVEADLVDQALALLNGGYDRAAAVVAGAVVEERLRAVAPSWGVAVTGGSGKPLTLGPLNDELKKAGAYDGIMQKRILLLGGLRNAAAHGEAFENRSRDVESMIRDAVSICAAVTPK